MAEGRLKIHSENILPIIKKWLYSDKEIFVRELISNSCDAIEKLRMLEIEDSYRIDVKIDKERGTLTFSDNGIGMDAEEVEKYIAQIAFSGAEEFISKYKEGKEGEQIIGHFGLGFYSAYMVAKHVKIQTLSFKEGAEPVLWSCDGSSSYTIEKGTRISRGTEIILTLEKEEEEYLDALRIRQILHHYCAFLPHPIYLSDSQINEKPPLWIKPVSECTEKEYLDFYRTLFPLDGDPLFWVHLNVDYPFHLKGILYFPKISREENLRKDAIKLFCNRVFVSDNCKDLLPDYLMILRGAIDSPDIPLNVSRSYLQMDSTVRQLGKHISKKISDRLLALYKTERDKFLSYWPDIEMIIKYGALQDDKFYDRIKEFLVWKNSNDLWTTVEEYLERREEKIVYYAPEEKSPFYTLFKEKSIEMLLIPPTLLNNALLGFLEQKTSAKFRRIDADLSDKILDPSKEKSLLDAEGKSVSGKIAAFFRKKLDLERVEAKSLASASLPACLVIKEEERRLREAMTLRGHDDLKMDLVKPTFVVNTNSKLIDAICKIDGKNPDLAKEMAQTLYDMTRLSHKEIEPENLSELIARNASVLEKLALGFNH